MKTLTASPLARTVTETPTDVWNDSCAVDELEYAVAFGAWWLFIIGGVLGSVALSGWIFEYYRGEHAH